MDMLRLHEPRSYLLFSGQLFRSKTLPSSFLFQQLSVDILYFKTITSFNKNLRKCFSSEHTRFSLNAWLTLNLSMFRVWRNIMKTLMCVALIKRSVASLMLENLTAISKNGALPLLNSCVDLILRCYFIDHLKMTPSFSSPHYPLRSRYTLSMCVTSSFQLFPPFTTILISFSWDVPLCSIILDDV